MALLASAQRALPQNISSRILEISSQILSHCGTACCMAVVLGMLHVVAVLFCSSGAPPSRGTTPCLFRYKFLGIFSCQIVVVDVAHGFLLFGKKLINQIKSTLKCYHWMLHLYLFPKSKFLLFKKNRGDALSSPDFHIFHVHICQIIFGSVREFFSVGLLLLTPVKLCIKMNAIF